MRIGINASFLRKPGTGIGQVTFNFLKELKEFPHEEEIEFFIYTEEELQEKGNYPKNFHFRNFLPFWKRDDVPRKWFWERKLSRQAQKDGCEAFLSLYQSATVFPRSFRHVMVVHDLIPFLFPEYAHTLSRRLYQRGVKRGIHEALHIVSISEATSRDLVQFGVSAEKISVAYPGTPESFREKLPDEEVSQVLAKFHLSPGYIYHGGGLEKRKNTEGVLRAYALLQKKYPGKVPKLVISGKIFPESNPLTTPVRALVLELGLEKEVILTDFLPEREIQALYQGALFFVYPSFYEGFGLPVLEAFAADVPVITSHASSLPEVGGDAVYYVDPSETDELTAGMEKLLTDPLLRQALISKSSAQALQFQWLSFVERIMKNILST